MIASSTRPRALKQVAHPRTLSLEILPRRSDPRAFLSARDRTSPILRHDDTLRLTVHVFDETFHLHLRPTTHLLHPDAVVHHLRPGATGGPAERYASARLLPSAVRAYTGEVVPASLSPQRMREDAAGVASPAPGALGWARIVVHEQGDASHGREPVFEGAFAVRGVVHHVQTRTQYLRHAGALDPALRPSREQMDEDGDAGLVVWRDSDVMSEHEEAAARDGKGPVVNRKPQTCAHDGLPWNSDPKENAALRVQHEAPWYSPSGFAEGLAATFSKRDDLAMPGNSSTEK